MPSSHACGAVFVAALLAVPSLAQVRDPSGVTTPGAQPSPAAQGEPQPASRTWRELALRNPSAAVVEQGGEVWGCGDAYKVRFDAAQVEFVPALPSAPHNYPLRYELSAIGRGEDLQPVGGGERRLGERRVEYRYDNVVEWYDVRPEGVEQGFVFDALPPGSGDLVVRGAVSTALQVSAAGDGLRCELPGVGGFTIGGVTGIDAAGNRVAGSMHFAEGVLDYRLPASFLATARLPIVLDPLLGSIFSVAVSSTSDDGDPDAAFDVGNNVYLVAFERVFSAADHDIHCQRVSGAGALIGSRIFLENTGAYDYQPSVANSNSADRFVVAWTRLASPNYDVRANSVSAADGSFPGTQLLVASSTDVEYWPDVGGEATTLDDDVLVVWSNLTTESVVAAQLGFNGDGSLFAWDTTTITTDATFRPLHPRISKSGGTTGNHLIVWSREIVASADYDPQCAAYSRELSALDTLFTLDTAVNYTQFPDVDGDGNHWVAAWLQREASGTDGDIVARALSFSSQLGSLAFDSAILPIENDASDDERDANVCWTGGTWLIGFRDEVIGTSNYEIAVKSIDPFTCALCEGEFFPFAAAELNVAMASEQSGGGTGDGALIAVEAFDTLTSTSDVRARLWNSVDGNVADAGGGCGSDGGVAYATCAKAGNAGFAVRLVDGLANTAALLVVSRSARSIPCGSCRLVPDPYTGWVASTTTDSSGRAAFASALPASASLVGLSVYAQWLAVEPVTPGCYLFGSDLSDAIRVVIE